MFVSSVNQSSKPTTWGTSNKGYTPPDPSDRGACARFRMRRKASRSSSRRPNPPTATVSELQQAKVELYRELKRLSEIVLQQALSFSDHLSACTSVASNTANLVSAGLRNLAQPQVQPESDDTVLSGIPDLAPSIPSGLSSSLDTSSNPTQNQTFPTPSSDSSPEKSISSSLPRLRGFFNKSGRKLKHDGCG